MHLTIRFMCKEVLNQWLKDFDSFWMGTRVQSVEKYLRARSKFDDQPPQPLMGGIIMKHRIEDLPPLRAMNLLAAPKVPRTKEGLRLGANEQNTAKEKSQAGDFPREAQPTNQGTHDMMMVRDSR
ncbi:MAG: hypothetical protein VW804_01490 [Verrucomicrobiota bacterium]